VPAGAFLDGRSCWLLAQLLGPGVRQLGSGPALDELRPALEAIGRAAEHERVAAAGRLRPAPVGWLSTAQAAAAVGISERAIRKRIDVGKLPALRQGHAWKVDASALAG
jgi:excisionase family DNA binding protein